MADYWIKLYQEILEDSKMAILPDRLWRRCIELFLLASRYHNGGELPDVRQLAWVLRMSPDDLEMDLKQLEITGIIKSIPNGWFVVNFAKRQAPVSSKDRMAKMRAKKHREEYESITGSLRDVTQINRLTESESESESDSGELRPLIVSFTESTNIPEFSFRPRDIESLNKMNKAGVIPEDIGIAVDELTKKDYTIVGPSSVERAALNCMRKRLHKNNQSLLKEEFAEEW